MKNRIFNRIIRFLLRYCYPDDITLRKIIDFTTPEKLKSLNEEKTEPSYTVILENYDSEKFSSVSYNNYCSAHSFFTTLKAKAKKYKEDFKEINIHKFQYRDPAQNYALVTITLIKD